MIKMFKCIVDDGKDVFKAFLPAKDKKELLSVWGGNGDFVVIEDVTEDYAIDVNKLRDTLQRAGYGVPEERMICYLVDKFYKNSYGL